MGSTEYSKARDIFLRLKERINNFDSASTYLQFFVDSVNTLVREYDTKNRENRFTVGHVVEILLVALFRAFGFDAEWIGAEERRSDICVDGVNYSVKTSFTPSGDIRLINVMGEDLSASWAEPTLFLLSRVGLVYLDPNLAQMYGIQTKRVSDAVTIRRKDVEIFAKTASDWAILMQGISNKEKNPEKIRTASMSVAKDVAASVDEDWAEIVESVVHRYV